MNAPEQPRGVFARLYARLLARAPRELRRRYAEDMQALASARVREAGVGRRTWRALRELVDLWMTIRRGRASAAGRGMRAQFKRRPTLQGRLAAEAEASAYARVVKHALSPVNAPALNDRPASIDWRTESASAWRSLRRRPGVALGVIGTLSVGLGAGVVGFSLLSTVLLRPLPYGAPDRLVFLWGVPPPMMAAAEVPLRGARLVGLQKDTRAFDAIEGFKADVFNLDPGHGARERVNGLLTTASLFETLRVAPVVGRAFVRGEDVEGGACAAVIGYGVWQRVFGGDVSIAGRAVRLNERACTIVGVAPRGFEFPRGGEMPASFQFPDRKEIWVASPPPMRGPSDLTLLARLHDGVSVAAAQAELDADAAHRDQTVRGSRGWNGIRATPFVRQVVPPFAETTVRALFGAVMLLMLIAAGNAAQLLVAHGLRQRVELGVRTALGASPARLGREALLAAAMATACAAAVGLTLGAAALAAIRAIGPERFPRLSEASLDWRVALFLAAGGAAVALLAAAGPMWVARRADINAVLRERARGGSTPYGRLRAVLVAVQVAFAVVLVIGSGLLVRSFAARMQVSPGFTADGVLTFEITLPPERYPEMLRGAMPSSRPELVAALDALLVELRALPGVEHAAAGKPLPMSGAQESTVFAIEGHPPPTSVSEMPIADYVAASDDLFAVLRTPIIAGRELTSADREDTERVIIVSRTFAAQSWPGVPPVNVIGKRVKLGGSTASPAPWLTVVGVVADVTRFALDEVPVPVMYVPHRQGPYPSLTTMPFVVRASNGDASALVPAVRAAAARAGLNVPIANAAPYARMVARVSDDARFAMALMTGFALMAVVLSMAGLYGVVAFTASERRGELGIRTALGAAPGALLRLVIGDGLRPVLVGGLAGVSAAMLAARWMRVLLFHTSPFDASVAVGALVLLAVAALAACSVPAMRACRVDPRETLQR